MSRRIKDAYIITPKKKQVGKKAAYTISLFSMFGLATEIPIIIYTMYYLIPLPIIIFILIDYITKKKFAWYRLQEFKVTKPNGAPLYLQYNYYDSVSTDDSWIKVYKIVNVERYNIVGNDCIVYCNDATVQNPPMRPKKVKKIKIYDIDDTVIGMIQEIQRKNKEGEAV